MPMSFDEPIIITPIRWYYFITFISLLHIIIDYYLHCETLREHFRCHFRDDVRERVPHFAVPTLLRRCGWYAVAVYADDVIAGKHWLLRNIYHAIFHYALSTFFITPQRWKTLLRNIIDDAKYFFDMPMPHYAFSPFSLIQTYTLLFAAIIIIYIILLSFLITLRVISRRHADYFFIFTSFHYAIDADIIAIIDAAMWCSHVRLLIT